MVEVEAHSNLEPLLLLELRVCFCSLGIMFPSGRYSLK